MKCNKCHLELTVEVVEACGRFHCPNKEVVNTSGKVNQLFVVEGDGFVVDNVEYRSGTILPL